MVKMLDGARLHTAVYLPYSGGRHPTVLTRVPYDITAPDVFIADVAPAFLDAGFAFVAQDTRGKARSEGTVELFAHEADDAAATLDWIVSQRWSSGDVFMWGESYSGFTQLAAAAAGHRALKGITPKNTSGDVGRGWIYRNNVPRLLFQAIWTAHTGIDHYLYQISEQDFDWFSLAPRDLLDASLPDVPRDFAQFLQRGPAEEYWTRRAFGGRTLSDASSVPTLHIGGWFDQFRHAQLREWQRARAGSSTPHFLEMRPNDHLDFEIGSTVPRDVWAAREHAVKGDPSVLVASQIHFFHWLLGRNSKPPALSLKAAFGEAVGETAAEFEAGPSWFVHSDGFLDEHGNKGEVIRWLHRGMEPVPSTQPDEIRWVGSPAQDLELGHRDDVFMARSEATTAPLVIFGQLRLITRVHLHPNRPAYLMAKLLDVDAHGKALRIADGATTVAASDSRIALDMGPTFYTLRPGHHLRLLLSGSDFPRYPLPPLRENDPWGSSWTGDIEIACDAPALSIDYHGIS